MTVKPITDDPMLPRYTDKCRCMECGEYFWSSYGFTEHRVGNWENNGVNRRCLTTDEMIKRRWRKNKSGHWISGSRDVSAVRRIRHATISTKPISE